MTWSKLTAPEKFLQTWWENGFVGSDMTPEYVIDEELGYRLDFAWPSARLGVEIHGFGFGHQRAAGLVRDCTKIRHSMLLGWEVLPFSTSCLATKDGCQGAVAMVVEMISRRHPDVKRCHVCGMRLDLDEPRLMPVSYGICSLCYRREAK